LHSGRMPMAGLPFLPAGAAKITESVIF